MRPYIMMRNHYWDEDISRCQDCGANITGHATQHLLETGHTGYYSDVIHHKDLVHEAYDEQVWVDGHDETVYVWFTITETYCTECGEVLSHTESQ